MGCQRYRKTRPYEFRWQQVFVMELCLSCVVTLILARPIYLTWGLR